MRAIFLVLHRVVDVASNATACGLSLHASSNQVSVLQSRDSSFRTSNAQLLLLNRVVRS